MGVAAGRVKHTRKCAFSPALDVFDYCTPDLQETLKLGRLKAREKKEDEDERRAKMITDGGGDGNGMDVDTAGDHELVPAALAGLPEEEGCRKEWVKNPNKKPLKNFTTGMYELIGAISHKGRSAEGGHYVSWVRSRRASDEADDEVFEEGKKGKKKAPTGSSEDTWFLYDDEDVSSYKYKDIVGMNIDLQGGRADTQIAYVLLYKRVPCVMPDEAAREIQVDLTKDKDGKPKK